MYHHDNCYEGMQEKDLWTLLLLGHYCLRQLQEKYGQEISKVYGRSFCGDGRRIPTVRKHLQELGLIECSWRTDDKFIPIADVAELMLQEASTKEPKFNTSGYIVTKQNYFSEEERKPVKDLEQVYVDIDNLNAHELIHVYLNQDLYDFRKFKVTTSYQSRRSYGSTEYERFYLKLYPISALQSSDEVTFKSNCEAYAKAHATEILSEALDLNFQAMADDKPYMTGKDIYERIEKVEDKLRLLRRTCRELKVLMRKVCKLGDEALQKKLLDTSERYVKYRAPIWINSKDKDKKELAMLVCKGAQVTQEKTVKS